MIYLPECLSVCPFVRPVYSCSCTEALFDVCGRQWFPFAWLWQQYSAYMYVGTVDCSVSWVINTIIATNFNM